MRFYVFKVSMDDILVRVYRIHVILNVRRIIE